MAHWHLYFRRLWYACFFFDLIYSLCLLCRIPTVGHWWDQRNFDSTILKLF